MYIVLFLTGRPVVAPELHKTSTQTNPLSSRTVAVNRRYKDQNGGARDRFCQCRCLRMNKTMASYASKGSLILWMERFGRAAGEKNGVI